MAISSSEDRLRIRQGDGSSADEVAVRYYSDQAFLTAIRLRRNGRSTD